MEEMSSYVNELMDENPVAIVKLGNSGVLDYWSGGADHRLKAPARSEIRGRPC